jgi:hypothetical protein
MFTTIRSPATAVGPCVTSTPPIIVRRALATSNRASRPFGGIGATGHEDTAGGHDLVYAATALGVAVQDADLTCGHAQIALMHDHIAGKHRLAGGLIDGEVVRRDLNRLARVIGHAAETDIHLRRRGNGEAEREDCPRKTGHQVSKHHGSYSVGSYISRTPPVKLRTAAPDGPPRTMAPASSVRPGPSR